MKDEYIGSSFDDLAKGAGQHWDYKGIKKWFHIKLKQHLKLEIFFCPKKPF
jgi:hypothetical protein